MLPSRPYCDRASFAQRPDRRGCRLMLMAITDPEIFAILLTILVATAFAGRVVILAIENSHPFLLLGSWLLAMVGGCALWLAAQTVLAGFWPSWNADLVGQFVRQHELVLAALLVIGTVAAVAMEILRPARRSMAAEDRAGAIGSAGEALVARALGRAGYPTLHGVMVGGRSWSTEIDHIVRSPGSILAIETKTLSGRVEGRPGDRQWVQRGSGRERWFLNPLRQNATHLDVLRRAIGAIDVPLRGVVVFAGTATIADELRGVVVSLDDLISLLDREPVLNSRSLDQAWSIVEQLADRGGDRRSHVAYVRRRWRRA